MYSARSYITRGLSGEIWIPTGHQYIKNKPFLLFPIAYYHIIDYIYKSSVFDTHINKI